MEFNYLMHPYFITPFTALMALYGFIILSMAAAILLFVVIRGLWLRYTRSRNPLLVFRKIYTYINDETLHQAARDYPDLLARIIRYPKTTNLILADTLYALSTYSPPDHFLLIKKHIDHHSAEVREASYMSLYQYYDTLPQIYSELLLLFKSRSTSEPDPQVRERIQELYKQMEKL